MTEIEMKAELAELRATFAEQVTRRVALILRADRVAPGAVFDAAATDAEIRATAVAAALGPDAIDGRTQDYIHARFDHLAEQRTVDPVRVALSERLQRTH